MKKSLIQTMSQSTHTPGIHLEFAWNLPGICLEFAWNDLESPWNPPGICLEFAWNGPGICLEWTQNSPGMDLEFAWNGPGMDLEWAWNSPGIHLEWTWNGPGMDLEFTWNPPGIGLKKTLLFFTRIPPGMTWNDLEWQIIWVWIFYLEWGGNLSGFLPNSYHSTWIHLDSYHSAQIWAECVGEGKVLPHL